LEQKVDLVLCGNLMQVYVMRITFVPERLPVKFDARIKQEINDFFISVLTIGESF
jgi:hypothetical protein